MFTTVIIHIFYQEKCVNNTYAVNCKYKLERLHSMLHATLGGLLIMLRI